MDVAQQQIAAFRPKLTQYQPTTMTRVNENLASSDKWALFQLCSPSLEQPTMLLIYVLDAGLGS
jgi:hypothetical protein